MIKIKSDKIIVGENLFNGYIYIENDKIVEVSKENKPSQEEYDYTGKYVSAGFIEMHTHGAGGFAFINDTVEDVIRACEHHLAHGATSILPTVTTAPFSVMKEGVINISKAKRLNKCKSNILGAHLEGPYLSTEQVGAQSPDNITEPKKEDYIPLIKEYKEDIKRWTYAPERDQNGEFCKYLVENGIIASAGHSNATYKDMKKAVENGLSMVTHIYSASSTVTRNQGFRSLGVIESAFLMDEIYAEIIADGRHLPPELVNMIVKIKGKDKVVAVTDSMEIAGTDVKEGNLSGVEYIVEEGVCRLKDRSAFAGSIATCDRLVRVLTKECGYSVCDAVYMMTQTPAKILGVNKGSIKAGYDADVIVFDEDVNIKSVFVMGKKVI
jgi:N-acetylglucosamine-6-phosphate deacetylase